MNVQELIHFMAIQSISQDMPDDQEQTTYLIWLNIAYQELYRQLVGVNGAWMAKQSGEIEIVNGVGQSPLPADFFRQLVMQDVTQCNLILPMRTWQWVLEQQQYNASSSGGNPFGITNGYPINESCGNACGPAWVWYVTNQTQINLWPAPVSARVRLTYIPTLPPLAVDTPENEIFIPVPYQMVLAYGALINLYKSEANLRSNIDIADTLRQYKAGKQGLFSYFARNYDDYFRSRIVDF